YETAPIWVRVPKPTGEDSFFGGIIKTPDTVPHMLCLRRRKLETLGTRSRTKYPDDPDVMFLFTLSRAGLQGHPATAHGGFLNVLFDEMMGQTMTCHYPPTDNGGYFTSGGTLYTANLNVNFRAPMALPGTYLYRGWMTRQEGRKSWVEGELVDVKGGGRVLAEGTSLWVTVGKEIEMPGREKAKI
ncbi:MAG: hypothetical protein M1823_008353, partial [Watsoniomyces obsoletus]